MKKYIYSFIIALIVFQFSCSTNNNWDFRVNNVGSDLTITNNGTVSYDSSSRVLTVSGLVLENNGPFSVMSKFVRIDFYLKNSKNEFFLGSYQIYLYSYSQGNDSYIMPNTSVTQAISFGISFLNGGTGTLVAKINCDKDTKTDNNTYNFTNNLTIVKLAQSKFTGNTGNKYYGNNIADTTYAYIENQNTSSSTGYYNKIDIVNIQKPLNLQLTQGNIIDSYGMEGGSEDFDVSDNKLVIIKNDDLTFFDLTNKSAITSTGTYTITKAVQSDSLISILSIGNYVYALIKGSTNSYLQILDVTNPKSVIVKTAKFDITGTYSSAKMYINGNYLFVGMLNNIYVLNVASPTSVSLVETKAYTGVFTVNSNYLYRIISQSGVNKLEILDITDPVNWISKGIYNYSGRKIVVSNNYVALSLPYSLDILKISQDKTSIVSFYSINFINLDYSYTIPVIIDQYLILPINEIKHNGEGDIINGLYSIDIEALFLN